jgi:hypothetical protein
MLVTHATTNRSPAKHKASLIVGLCGIEGFPYRNHLPGQATIIAIISNTTTTGHDCVDICY